MTNGLKELIDSCSLTNFNDDQEKIINNYVATFINTHQLPIKECATGMFLNKNSIEFKNLENNPILQHYSFYIEQCKLLFKHIYNKHVREKKNSDFKTCLSYLVSNSFMILTSINTLLISGCYQSVMTEFRTLYENYIILSFLKKYPETIEPFNDHFFICSLSLEKELAKLKGEDISDKHSQKIQKLKDKYDEHFDDDYGWTYKVIEKRKERNLETIFNESNLNKAFTLLYKESCKFTHSTSYSVLFKPDFIYVKRFLYASIEILRNEFDLIFEAVKMPNKDRMLLHSFMLYLTNSLLVEIENSYS
ncbi:MAG: hypothetical protein J5527_02995 [Treponema sp.]|nr:hypothetical protein [Treponema sp.]